MFSAEFAPAGFDFHPNGALKASSILKYMQSAAMTDVANAGASYETLRKENMIFVAYKTVLEICGTIGSEQTVNVRTWNKPMNGVKYNRDFIMSSGEQTVARGLTVWALTDYVKRTVVRPHNIKHSIEEFIEDAGLDCFVKIEDEDCVKCAEIEWEIRFSDLDINGHLNNTAYADVAVDCSPFDMNNYRVKMIQLMYRHEVQAGEHLKIDVLRGDHCFVVRAFDTKREKLFFEAKIFLLQILL